jgi:predicted outer membrane protein
MRNLISRTGLVFAIALCMTVACWAQAQTGTSKQGTYSTTNQTPAASAFLKKAMEANEAEIEFGRMAQTKAQDQRVKDFANMMVTDHTQMLNRLHDMGTSTSSTHHNHKQTSTNGTGGMQLSKADQMTKNRLSKLSGAAFDRAYMETMVQDHRKDVREFEMEAGVAPGSTTSSTSDTSSDSQTASREKPGMNTSENSAKAFARETLPMLKKHLEEAEMIQREMAQTK